MGCFSSKTSTKKAILDKPFENIKKLYILGEKLGEGQFGITRKCQEISTGKTYACKSILKKKLKSEEAKMSVKREIQIMEHLSGEPNIIEFKCAYEDQDSVHLMMEFCGGGDLFNKISKAQSYSEKDAVGVIRQIVNIVQSCHNMGVMHRDLKPENLLLSSNEENAMLKAIDFGCSVFIEKGEAFRDSVGSSYYVAPEVLQGNYGKEADIWSAGIILYILLCGIPPFVLSKKLSKEEIKGLETIFTNMDTDNSGTITHEELRRGLTKFGSKLTETEVKQLIEAADLDSNGTIDREEFISVMMMHSRHKLDREQVYELFQHFDKDKDGHITRDQLEIAMKEHGVGDEASIKQIISEVDTNNDGLINYEEFRTMMNRDTEPKGEILPVS